MTIRKGKVIIDTNLLMQALDYRKSNVFDWIDQVYENIYVHMEVVNEFQIESERKSILEVIEVMGWKLFDHNNKDCLLDEHKSLYWTYVKEVHEGFEKLKAKKEAQGRIPKTSNNIGEIHSIALAQLISGNIISSNDYEIREVIEDENIRVHSPELKEDILIEQDTIEDFCVYCVQANVVKPSDVLKFFKICHSSDSKDKLEEKVSSLKNRLMDVLSSK